MADKLEVEDNLAKVNEFLPSKSKITAQEKNKGSNRFELSNENKDICIFTGTANTVIAFLSALRALQYLKEELDTDTVKPA